MALATTKFYKSGISDFLGIKNNMIGLRKYATNIKIHEKYICLKQSQKVSTKSNEYFIYYDINC